MTVLESPMMKKVGNLLLFRGSLGLSETVQNSQKRFSPIRIRTQRLKDSPKEPERESPRIPKINLALIE